jgi:hypothetical protein
LVVVVQEAQALIAVLVEAGVALVVLQVLVAHHLQVAVVVELAKQIGTAVLVVLAVVVLKVLPQVVEHFSGPVMAEQELLVKEIMVLLPLHKAVEEAVLEAQVAELAEEVVLHTLAQHTAQVVLLHLLEMVQVLARIPVMAAKVEDIQPLAQLILEVMVVQVFSLFVIQRVRWTKWHIGQN